MPTELPILEWYQSQLAAQQAKRDARPAEARKLGRFIDQGGTCYLGINAHKRTRKPSESVSAWKRRVPYAKPPEVKLGAGPKCSKQHPAAYLQNPKLSKAEARVLRNAAKRERRERR